MSGLAHPEVQYLHHLRMSWRTAAPELLSRNRAVMRPYPQMALMEDKALTQDLPVLTAGSH